MPEVTLAEVQRELDSRQSSPQSVTVADIEAELARRSQAPKVGIGEAIGRGALTTLIENVGGLAGTLPNPFETSAVSLLREAQRSRVPSAPTDLQIRATPDEPGLQAEDLLAGITTAGQIPGGLLRGEPLALGQRFREAQQKQQAITRRFEEQRPIASGAGALLADVGTIALTRQPFRQPAQKILGEFGRRFQLRQSLDKIPPGTKRVVNRALRSEKFASLTRGAGRTVETSLEGAILGIAKEEDPAELARIGAMQQFAGNVGRWLVPSVKGGFKRLGITAATAATAIQLAKEFTPGGRDSIIESAETGFSKTAQLFMVGLPLAIAGSRVGRGSVLEKDYPMLIDALGTIPRASVLSLTSSILDEEESGESQTATVLDKVSQDPTFFGEERAKQLLAGIRKGDLGARVNRFIETDEAFRNKFDTIGTEQEAPPPSAEGQLRDAVSADNKGTNPLNSTKVAESLGRHVGRDSPLQKSFAKDGPRSFTGAVFNDADAFTAAWPKLGKRQRADALELELTQLLNRSLVRRDGRNTIDGNLFQKRWQALPEPARSAYPEEARQNIDSFISEALASTEPVSVLPPLLARSLMMVDGELAKRLRGED